MRIFACIYQWLNVTELIDSALTNMLIYAMPSASESLLLHLYRPIGPMHEENVLGNTPKRPIASFSFSLLKVGILIFQRF